MSLNVRNYDAGATGVIICTEVPGDLRVVSPDRVQLQQMLVNGAWTR